MRGNHIVSSTDILMHMETCGDQIHEETKTAYGETR